MRGRSRSSPSIDLGAIGPTDAQKADAKAKADAALKDIQGGKSLGGRREDGLDRCVDRAAGRRPRLDRGHRHAPRRGLPEGPLRGRRSTPRRRSSKGVTGPIGSVASTEITPEAVDTAYQAKIENDGVARPLSRGPRGGRPPRQAPDKIVGDVTGPSRSATWRRSTSSEAAPNLGTDAIKVRHILYSPKDDPSGAAAVAPDDPAWEGAHRQALATWARLKDNPSLFDAIARTESDEGQARVRPAAAASSRSSTARARWTTRSRRRSSRRA